MRKSLLLSALVSGLIVACGGIDGTLSVQQSFELKDRKGDVSVIPAGSHAVNLKYKENKQRLIVTFDELNGQKTVIESKTPDGFELPDNGPFSLKASEYGQTDVNLDGVMSTTQTQSEEQWGRQSCQYQDWETICNTAPNGQTSCYQRPVNRYGNQDIRYFDVTTDRRVQATFTKVSSGAAAARLNGRNLVTERRVTYQGHCGW